MPTMTGLDVTLQQVHFSEEVQTTPDRPFGFIYDIAIVNEAAEPVTIKGRKWVVTTEKGEKIITEGSGVAGDFPRIEPGGSFQYNGYHLVDSDSVAEGAYLGQTDSGKCIIAKIPPFSMRIPHEAS